MAEGMARELKRTVKERNAQPSPPWHVQQQAGEAKQQNDRAGCAVGERRIPVNFSLVLHDLPIHSHKALFILILIVVI
eukprot:13199106-Ditylum_brightwellii.AAC.1